MSNLTFLSNLIERLLCLKLTAYLCDNQLLVQQQSAYREYHSTETALLKVASDVFDAMDTGDVTILALLDLSAAFDTVDHDILLQRLSYSYGIGGTALHWLKSFLTDRVQAVIFGDQQSTRTQLTCGVPQGSVSGPLLFTLYTAGCNCACTWDQGALLCRRPTAVRVLPTICTCSHCPPPSLYPGHR